MTHSLLISRRVLTALGIDFSVESAKAKTNASFGAAPDNAVIWLQRLGCDGTETDIASCVLPGQPLGHTDCAHGEDASVVCTGNQDETQCSGVGMDIGIAPNRKSLGYGYNWRCL